jgi:2'-5' RNA ligase
MANAASADDKPKRLRLFVSINLPDEVRQHLAKLQAEAGQSIRKCVRWTRPEQLHLTLKFLAHIDEKEVPNLRAALADACKGANRFNLEAASVGCFPRPSAPRIIWVGIIGDLDRLLPLQKQIDDATTPWKEPENRPFTAHLTVGRVNEPNQAQRQAIGRFVEANQSLRFGQWTVQEIDLMQSRLSPTGSTYTRLDSLRLVQTA